MWTLGKALRKYPDKNLMWRRGYVAGVRCEADPDVSKPLPDLRGYGEEFQSGFKQGRNDCAFNGCSMAGLGRVGASPLMQEI